MARLHKIEIKNFRGLKSFTHSFKEGVTCIVGRGDSGKTTLLDAVSFVLSPSYSLRFYDSDFYGCDVNEPIEIIAHMVGLDERLLAKYGDYIRGLFEGEILDNMELPNAIQSEPLLSIRLQVDKSLEPVWELVTGRDLEPKPINGSSRALFNVYKIGDYFDRHLSFTKGNPLYRMYQDAHPEEEVNSSVVNDIIRSSKQGVDTETHDKFKDIVEALGDIINTLGLSTSDIKAEMDFRDILIHENKVSLHEDGIPLRLKGKGSKRLLSLAIQLSMSKGNSVILLDEIEMGLEPDRVQHLVRKLKTEFKGQFIFTTHSRDVVTELGAKNLYLLREQKTLLEIPNSMQACIRANPEALFAKRIIIGEGATEVGICRAISNWLDKNRQISFACKGIKIIDGHGKTQTNYARELNSLGYDVCMLCDSDEPTVNNEKHSLSEAGITIVDCQDNNAIEDQIFNDLHWDHCVKLIEYLIEEENKESKSIFDSIKSLDSGITYGDSWYKNETETLRSAFGRKSKSSKNSWFKKITPGEFVGEQICNWYDSTNDDNNLRQMISKLITWVDI